MDQKTDDTAAKFPPEQPAQQGTTAQVYRMPTRGDLYPADYFLNVTVLNSEGKERKLGTIPMYIDSEEYRAGMAGRRNNHNVQLHGQLIEGVTKMQDAGLSDEAISAYISSKVKFTLNSANSTADNDFDITSEVDMLIAQEKKDGEKSKRGKKNS